MTSGKCTGAYSSGTTIKTGYAYIQSVIALAGNRVNGVLACPQEVQQCPGAKILPLAKGAGSTAANIAMKMKGKYTQCSYLIEASCDAPYVYLDTTTGYANANHANLKYSVIEYDENFGEVTTRKFWSDTEIAGANQKFVPATALANYNSLTDAALKLIPSDIAANTYTANAGDGKNQRQLGRKAKWFQYKDQSSAPTASNVETDAWTLNQLMKAKKAEYASFNTAKTAYETKKTDYNTKLAAAEKLQKDTIDKDIFRKLSPTEEDKKVLNAVPVRPNNPSVPSAYSGPTLAASATAYKKNTLWVPALAQETDVDAASTGADAVKLGSGKSFGTVGYGNNESTAPAAGATLDGKGIDMGVIFKEYSTGTTCTKHYMMFQAGYAATNSADLTTQVQNVKYGAKGAAAMFETLTAPTAATDPSTPSTGASMLAAGAASLAVAMTLF